MLDLFRTPILDRYVVLGIIGWFSLTQLTFEEEDFFIPVSFLARIKKQTILWQKILFITPI